MEAIKLAIGNKLELELYDKNNESKMPLLASQFETLLTDGTMEILAPIHEGRLFPVHRNTTMDVIYQKDGDLFKFLAVVIERKTSGNIRLLRIQPITGEERTQRRNFFRFGCLLDVDYHMLKHKPTKNEELGEFKKAVTKDLSGGGLCLLINEKPHNNWFIMGTIDVGAKVHFIGRIVRVTNTPEKGRFKYEVGIEFDEITNLEREKIIGFIFDSQRKLLKKGWSGK